MIEIIPASPAHVGTIAVRMRTMDQLECMTFGHTPKDALRAGLLASSIVWTARINGRPEAMFGAVPLSLLESRARVWMLMTDEATKHARALVRLGRLYTEAMNRDFDILENMVHARNDVSIRWLARLGYAIGQVDVVNGQPMRPFRRCAIPSR